MSRARLTDRMRSPRVRAALGLGVLLGFVATGTFAYWTDEVPITGTSFSAGNLDLRVNGVDAATTTTLSMAAMVPGSSAAEVLTVRNNGTVPLMYTMTGGLTGADAGAYAAATALRLTVVAGATRSGTGSSATCTGGAIIVNAVPLSATPSTAIIGARRGPLAPAATEPLCVQITLDPAAPGSLQGRAATATFTLTGTSDVS